MRSNTIWVMTTITGHGTVAVDAWTSKDAAIDFAMESMFGEDWEMQMSDDDWESQGELLDAYDAFMDGRPYKSIRKEIWELQEVEVDEFAK